MASAEKRESACGARRDEAAHTQGGHQPDRDPASQQSAAVVMYYRSSGRPIALGPWAAVLVKKVAVIVASSIGGPLPTLPLGSS